MQNNIFALSHCTLSQPDEQFFSAKIEWQNVLTGMLLNLRRLLKRKGELTNVQHVSLVFSTCHDLL